MTRNQRTILKEVELAGTGLFSGKPSKLVFKPAGVNTGIRFVRVDLDENPHIDACIENLAVTPRRTTLGTAPVCVEMVEHLMAALYGLNVDNLIIDIDSSELPNGDGSSRFFVEALVDADFDEQDAPVKTFALAEPITVTQGDAFVTALPNEAGLDVAYTLSYDDGYIPTQTYSVSVEPQLFAKNIASARTFCLASEVEMLKEKGLGKGADVDNTVIVSPGGKANIALRYDNEMVRHKVLDLLGDISLVGCDLRAKVVAYKSGHALNLQLAKKLREMIDSAGDAPHDDEQTPLDINAIRRILPHRYPLLLVDRITAIEEDKITGYKNVTANEEFFQGHFPARPIMPGVLMLEAMAQLAGVFLLRKVDKKGKIPVILSINNVKFRKLVEPGDQLLMEAVVKSFREGKGSVCTIATVGGQIASEAEFKFMVIDMDNT